VRRDSGGSRVAAEEGVYVLTLGVLRLAKRSAGADVPTCGRIIGTSGGLAVGGQPDGPSHPCPRARLPY
jgi:hypothetical protein